MKILWIDLLCFKTIIIACLRKKESFDRIHYFNVNKNFNPFIDLVSKLINKPIIYINYVSESEQYINNTNLYQIIQERIFLILDDWIESKRTIIRINSFVDKNHFSKSKYSAHLRESAFIYAYRAMQILSIAEAIGGGHNNSFLLKKTPLKQEIQKTFAPQLVDFYNYSGRSFEKRENYYSDLVINKRYFRGNLIPSLKHLILWFSTSFSSLFNIRNRDKQNLSNIGLELIQTKIQENFINDSYWLENSRINPNRVIGLTSINYDSQSWANIDKLGITVFNISGSVINSVIHSIKYRNLKNKAKFIFADFAYFKNTISCALKIPFYTLSKNSLSWFRIQESCYLIRTEYWKSIYSQLDVRMLWSMNDIDEEKLVKAQAIELCKGIFLGSHWSNYPLITVYNSKCYDVFFVWSKYFASKSFTYNFKYKAIFEVGYTSDYYFKEVKNSSEKLRSKYSDNFIISYFDNTLANDLLFSENLQSKIYDLLIELLNSNKKIIIFFKPKRKTDFKNYLSGFPALKHYINIGRVKVFYGKTERSKARPAEISMASDLVIGAGISSAAAEGCFSGSVSFHANLSKINNDFDKNGINKIVFRDLKSLKKAIINQINGNGISIEESQKYHKILDSFQDGESYKRTGLILFNFQKEFDKGYDIDQVIKNTKDKFSEFSC